MAENEIMFLCEYEHLLERRKILIPAINRQDAEARLEAIAATGRVTGKVLGEIKGDSRLLTAIFGEE